MQAVSVLLGAALAVTASPLSGGQSDGSMAGSIESVEGELLPGGPPVTIRFKVQYYCRELLLAGPRGLTFEYRATSDEPWLGVSVVPQAKVVFYDSAACPPTAVGETRATVFVQAWREAPAFRSAEVAIQVQAKRGEEVAGEMGLGLFLRVGFVGELSARIDGERPVLAPSGTHRALLHVENLGNGAVRVNVTVAEAKGAGIRVRLPPSALLGSRAEGAPNQTELPLVFRAPEAKGLYADSGTHFVFLIASRSAQQLDLEGDAVEVRYTVHFRGMDSFDAPAPDPALVLLAVAAAAVLAAWRRGPP